MLSIRNVDAKLKSFVMTSPNFHFTLILLLCMLSVVKSTIVKGSFDTANGTFMFANPVPFYHHQLSSAQVESQEVKDVEECIFACGKTTQCHSVNFKTAAEANGKFLCHLFDTDKFVSPVLFTESLDFHHYSFKVSLQSHL